MVWKKTLPIILIMLMLDSCAGIGVFSTAQNEFELGLDLFNNGQYEEAIKHFNSYGSRGVLL